MRTTQLFLLGFLGLTIQFSNAQATIANTTNTVTAAAYLGSGPTSNFDVLFKRNNVPAGKLATTFTNLGVNSLALPNSVSFGVNAGQFSSGTGGNTYIGQNAGKGQSATLLNTGTLNTYIGNNSGINNASGGYNVFIGSNAGEANVMGKENVFIGYHSGSSNGNNDSNTYIGFNSGGNGSGKNNTYIGHNAGAESGGSDNIFIGNYAGFIHSVNNSLIIENSENPNPLIFGSFSNDELTINGKVGIGGNSSTGFIGYPGEAGGIDVSNYKLFVQGGILTEEVRVSLTNTWADYVFNKDYDLKPLNEVENYIGYNGHLPNMPSAKEVKENGIELGEMAKMQQEKIEELTLYLIQQNKEIEALKAQVKLLIERK